MTSEHPPSLDGSPADSLPLSGLTVLDFTRFVAGPYATMLLADAGAEVVKVEPPGGESTRQLDPMIETPSGLASGYFVRFNRSKKSLVLDLRSEHGVETIRRLIPHFDVLVENYRPGVMDSLGLSYSALSAIAPELIYCSISGYGQTESEQREDPAFAIVAEVSAGVVGRGIRAGDPPVRLSAPLGDLFPASHAVSGICMALLNRHRTGQGCHVDIAMYDALVSLNENAVAMSATTGVEMLPTGALTYAAPFGIFAANDGYLCIAVLGESVWQRFCTAIQRPDLAMDESLSSGSARAAAMAGPLGTAISGWLSACSVEDALKVLGEHRVPCAKVNSPFDVINSPQTAARSLIWDVASYTGGSAKVVGSPIRLTGIGFAPVGRIPGPGEHTRAVLQTAGGLSAEEVDRLIIDGVAEEWSG